MPLSWLKEEKDDNRWRCNKLKVPISAVNISITLLFFSIFVNKI